MKTTQLTPTRVLLEFPTRKEMNLSMYRIAEFFESNEEEIKGKKFTFDVFADKYSDEKGNLDYFAYWEGFNIPKKIFNDFISLYGGELSARETTILQAVQDLPENGYIIACQEGDEETKKHEVAHGKFFEDEEYRNRATEIVLSMPEDLINRYKVNLSKIHYNEDVMIDEIHAYLVAYSKEEHDEVFPDIKEEEISESRQKLQELYELH